MITVIIIHAENSAIYMMPNRRTVADLMAHWISDCGMKASPDDMKFITLDGYTLTDATYVESIPLSDVNTRCVKALSRRISEEAAAQEAALALENAADNIAALKERQLTEERKMKEAGLYLEIRALGDQNEVDDFADVELRGVAATLTNTALEYKQDIAIKFDMPIDSFKLRKVDTDELLKDNVRLVDQNIAHNMRLYVEMPRTVHVQVVSRSHSFLKKADVFKDDIVVDKILERNIPLVDQRLCYNGCRLSVTRTTTIMDVFSDERFMTAASLELVIVLREPVVLTRKHRSRTVAVWPEDVVGCLLDVEEETEPPPPLVDRPIAERWAYKPELIKDVFFDDEGAGIKKGMLFYKGQELDPNKSFADVALPPWAIVALDPLQLVFEKEYELEHTMHIPMIATVADAKRMLLKERPALHVEDFQLNGPGRRFLSPSDMSLAKFGLQDGDRVTIDPVRVPHIVFIRGR